jgi:hypothetical protein
VKPLFEFGNLVLPGIGFKLTISQGLFKKDKAISQYDDKCYKSVNSQQLDVSIQTFAENNFLGDQEVIQYQTIDNLRKLQTLKDL